MEAGNTTNMERLDQPVGTVTPFPAFLRNLFYPELTMMKNISTFLLMTLFLCGCGGSGNVSVKGTIKFDDGTPLTQGTIMFSNDTTQANAVIGSNGAYALGGAKAGDGIAPGQYGVTIVARTGGGSDGRPLVYFIDPKYENAATSGLTCEVKGRMIHDITVTTPSVESLKELEQRASRRMAPPESAPPPGVTPGQRPSGQ